MEALLKIALVDFEENGDFDERVEKFCEEWEKVEGRGVDDEERKVMAQRLVRFAFTDDRDILGTGHDDGGFGWWYSFCNGSWQESSHTKHCWKCGECMDWVSVPPWRTG